MGQELECTMRHRRRAVTGRAHLETDYLLFRAPPAERFKRLFTELTGVKAAAGVLVLEFPGGPAEFELGRAAEKWAAKIRNPPSRLDKLGVKPGARVSLVGEFEEDFHRELAAQKAVASGSTGRAALVFFAAATAGHLKRLAKISAEMQPDAALWVVYPKGVTAVREIEVLNAGRQAGLKDIKVARFSQTHTALKFVVPLAAR